MVNRLQDESNENDINVRFELLNRKIKKLEENNIDNQKIIKKQSAKIIIFSLLSMIISLGISYYIYTDKIKATKQTLLYFDDKLEQKIVLVDEKTNKLREVFLEFIQSLRKSYR